MSLLLNIAAGNMRPLSDIYSYHISQKDEKSYKKLNIDKSYFSELQVARVEGIYLQEKEAFNSIYLKHDVFEYLQRTTNRFDIVCIYRFLEHVAFHQVLYFIYLVSRVCTKNSIIDVIVPDYKKLATMLLQEDVNSRDFERNNILLSTEILNEPYDPHGSIWTKDRLKYFFEFEGRFETILTQENFIYDDRDIYLRGIFRRKVLENHASKS